MLALNSFIFVPNSTMKKYYYSSQGEKKGPFSLEEIKDEGIDKDTLVWFEGLEKWTAAKDLDELVPLLELNPPPIPKSTESVPEPASTPPILTTVDSAPNLDSEAKPNSESSSENKESASKGWMIAGFVFAVLGGYLGAVMGINYALNAKYDRSTHKRGWLMVAVSVVFGTLWKLMAEAM